MSVVPEELTPRVGEKVERINKKIFISKNELSSISDEILSRFCLGIYKDNFLTHKMRLDD